MGTVLATERHCVKFVLGARLLPRVLAVFLSIVFDDELPSVANIDSLSFELSWFKACWLYKAPIGKPESFLNKMYC